MNEGKGPICAFVLDGKGGGRGVGWDGIRTWRPEDGTLWVHLDRNDERSRRWLAEESGLDPISAEALLEEETRPRSLKMDHGHLVILRGVNLNPGQDPEDMVSLRCWVEPGRIVTVRLRKLMAIEDVRSLIAAGRGPRDVGGLAVTVADRLVERMGPVLTDLEDEIDRLEGELLARTDLNTVPSFGELRRKAIMLRRYLAPQRDALARLLIEPLDWLSSAQKLQLREVGDQVIRYVEDLDAVRERASIIQEELTNRIGMRMNRTMYVLSLVATIFLPLGFLTGLLGVNVAGIPGADYPWAFALFAAVLLALATLEYLIFRRLRWI